MSTHFNLSDAPAASTSFQALMHSFASLSGLAHSGEGLGLELQAGPHTARVMPDPQHDELIVIEVDVGDATDAPAGALALLHRVNHMARYRHSWWVSLDMDDHIVLHTKRALARTDASALEVLLTDGLERAEAVSSMWQKCLLANTDEEAIVPPSWDSGALRA